MDVKGDTAVSDTCLLETPVIITAHATWSTQLSGGFTVQFQNLFREESTHIQPLLHIFFFFGKELQEAYFLCQIIHGAMGSKQKAALNQGSGKKGFLLPGWDL